MDLYISGAGQHVSNEGQGSDFKEPGSRGNGMRNRKLAGGQEQATGTWRGQPGSLELIE